MKLFKFLNRQNIAITVPVINSACYTTDDFLILSTSVGQFTFDPVDCDFAGVDDDVILFLFARKNANNRVENFNLNLDNSLKNKSKNKEIIAKFLEIKKRKSSINLDDAFLTP